MRPAAINFEYVHVDGFRVRVASRDLQGDGNTLLLLNGIGASIELLMPFMEALKNTKLVTLDVPGAGRSSDPRRFMRMSTYARVVTLVLDALELNSVSVMGVSWGGALAQEFAWRYPERCERLILAATLSSSLVAIPPKPSVLAKMSNPLRYWSPRYMISMAPQIYGGSLRTNRLKAREHAKKMVPPSMKGYYAQLTALIGWSGAHWLHRVKQPCLVLAGNDDPIIPLINAKITTFLLPNARLRVIDCGHLFVLTRADSLAPMVEDFLSD